MTIFAYHASSAMKHAYMGLQNALMLHTSVYHNEEVTSIFFSMHFTHWYGQKKVSNGKNQSDKKIHFLKLFTISFTYLQKSVFDRSPRPMCNWVHSPGQQVQSALQSDHFCSFHRFLNIYFGKNSWRWKKHFVFLELRLEKMNNFFTFSKTSRSEESNFSSHDVFGFLIFKFPMQNHNSKWAWVNEK